MSDSLEGQIQLLSEVALASSTLREFNEALCDVLEPLLGFDAGCLSWTRSPHLPNHITAIGYGEELLQRNFGRFMGELSAQEIAQFTRPRPCVDVEVLGPARRDALTAYRDLLRPHSVSSFVTNFWHAPSGVFGLHLARTGSVRVFSEATVLRLTQLLPVVRVGMALLASEEHAREGRREAESWTRQWRLSSRERDIVRLVARGFRNAEIAEMLRISPFTVRNHLASIFRKAEVTTRAELIFAMQAVDPATPVGVHASRPIRPWSRYLEHGLAAAPRRP